MPHFPPLYDGVGMDAGTGRTAPGPAGKEENNR